MNDNLESPATTTSMTSSDFEPKRAHSAEDYENKRAKFRRIVNRRVERATQAIRLVGRLGGRNAVHYDYSQADVDKIVMHLHEQVNEVGKRMYSPTGGHQLDVEFDVAKE